MASVISIGKGTAISTEEWELRVQLAACYRIFDHLGWTEMIFNHITLRVPGPEHHFLINPYGLHYSEVTASNLIKIDLDGNKISPSEWAVNPAGFIIHSAIHAHVPNAHCVMHTHTTTGMAVACSKEGLSLSNFYAAYLWDRVAYHDFEGTTTNPGEQQRLLASMGDKSCMILRNHGLLVQADTLPRAFMLMWQLQRACDVQVASRALGDVIPLTDQAMAQSRAAEAAFTHKNGRGWEVFEAMIRLVDRKDPSYRT